MRLNGKGFTLVELLAVIVILALLMILALPNILNVAESAKQKIFQTTLKDFVTAAETKYASDSLTGQEKSCYKISTLKPSAKDYSGCVKISQASTDIGNASYVWVYNDDYASFKGTIAVTKDQAYYSGLCDATAGTTFTCTSAMPLFIRTKDSTSQTTVLQTAITTNCPSTCG